MKFVAPLPVSTLTLCQSKEKVTRLILQKSDIQIHHSHYHHQSFTHSASHRAQNPPQQQLIQLTLRDTGGSRCQPSTLYSYFLICQGVGRTNEKVLPSATGAQAINRLDPSIWEQRCRHSGESAHLFFLISVTHQKLIAIQTRLSNWSLWSPLPPSTLRELKLK